MTALKSGGEEDGGGNYIYTGYSIINCSTLAVIETQDIDSEVSISCPGGSRFIFSPLGNLDTRSGTEIILSGTNKTCIISIVPATGAVKCIEIKTED